MAHEVLFAHSPNGYVRQLRSMLLDHPRVVRNNDHDDIDNLGITYTLGIGGSRPAGDILHVAAESGMPLTTHRATCVVGTAAAGSYQPNINVTGDWSSGSTTFTATDSTDFVTSGVVVGDLVRVFNAANTANNIVFRVNSITTTSTTNDTLTFETEDTVTGNDTGDVVDIRPITGGSVFRVREDEGSGNNFIGWMMSAVEFMANDGSVFLFMRDGGSWAVNDYAEWDMEAGHFTLFDEWIVTRTVDLNENGGSADTITRQDYNGNFLRDGFESGERVEISGSAGEDGTYTIVTAAAKTLTLNIGDFTGDELGVEVQLTPRQTTTVDFDDADAGFGNAPTIIRSTGSWVERGYAAGGQIEVADAASGANNGLFVIDSIDTDTNPNDTLVLASGSGIVDGTSDVVTVTPRNGKLQTWDEHRFIWGSSSGNPSNTNTLDNGEIPPVPDANDNYTSEWVAIAPGDDPANNPQTIYVGWQTQFSATDRQNVEMRGFDAVSDSSFGSLGNASPPTYIYLTNSPSMELFFTADGSHVTGFLDVNTAVTEWFYLGFGSVHGSENQHPRPMLIGGNGWESTASRTSSTTRQLFFPNGIDYTGTSDVNDSKSQSTCWHRWVDGQWFGVANRHQSNGSQIFTANDNNTEMFTWPYGGVQGVNYPFNAGADIFQGNNGTDRGDVPTSIGGFAQWLRATPTSITPGAANRVFPLNPVVCMMKNPNENIVIDFRNIFHLPGNAQATKNEVLQGGFKYIVGQNHDDTGQESFAAVRLA